MNFKYLIGALFVMLFVLPIAFSQSDLMVLHGKTYDNNSLMTSGDVRVQIYNQAVGGTLLYDSGTDFNGAIINGLFDVLLGSGIPLDLNLGQYYYYALQINAQDINFGTSLRQVFQSTHGDLNIYPISQLINDKNYLVPSALNSYLTKLDANGFYAFKTDVNLWTNQLLLPYLTKTDANGFYALRPDVNIWTNQLLVPYLTKVDANGFYTIKSDTNTWANQLILAAQLDSNKWSLSKLDANGFYVLKGDVNTWINQIAVPYIGATKDVNLGTYGISYYDSNWDGGRVINVPLDANLQAFIDNAAAGDTLILGSGTYTLTNTLNVNKRILIQGQKSTAIANFTADINVILITASSAELSDITIIDFGNNTKDIYLKDTNSVILNNIIISSRGTGFKYGVYSLNSSPFIYNPIITLRSTDQNAYGIYALNDSTAAIDRNLSIQAAQIITNGTIKSKGILVNNQNSSKLIGVILINSYVESHSTTGIFTYGLETTSSTTNNARAYIYNSTLFGTVTDVNGVGSNSIYLYATTLGNGTVGGAVHYLGTATANTFYFDINETPGVYHEGKMFYDSTWKTVDIQEGRDVTLQVGQEELTRIYNNTGSTIADGKAVFITGVYISGDNNVPTVALANASADANAQVFGITTQTIPNNDYGFITVRGYVNDLNTENASWNIGDTLYLSDTVSGELTNVAPSYSTSLQVKIGTLITKGITTGRINVRLQPVIKLGNLADVTITNPTLDQILKFNGINWVNGAASTVSGSNGIAFYPDGNDINSNTNQNFFGIESLYKYPITSTPQKEEGLVATAGLSPVEPYIYNTDLNRTLIDAGTWTFNMYLGANRIDRNPYLFNVIYKIRQYNQNDINVTTVGTGTTRYAIASSDAPFSTALIDTNFTANDQNLYAGYLQTPKGAYKVVGRTSDTNITISTPTTYVNETNVKFFTWKKLFMVRSEIITNITPAYSLYTISSSQGAFDMNLTDRIGMMIVGVASNTTTITYVYNGSTYYSYFNTPLITLHNNLAGLQGGSANEYYHLSQAQFIVATQAATNSKNGYLTSVDWTTFNSKANMSDLNAYLSKVDANGFYILKSDSNFSKTLIIGNCFIEVKTGLITDSNC